MSFKFPNTNEWDSWRPQFETQFKIYLEQMGSVVDVNGTITAFRIRSKYNPKTFVDLEVDGGIRITVNGNEAAHFPPV